MIRRLQAAAFLVVAAVAGFTGFYLNQARLTSAASEAAAQKLLLESFADLNGGMQTLSQHRGKVLVVNFWATWCAPCREEIPALMRVSARHLDKGVEFVGIAMDNVAKVREYASEFRIGYRLLIGGGQTLAISKDLGNQASVLPFTVVFDRTGKVAYAHVGAVTEATLDKVLLQLL